MKENPSTTESGTQNSADLASEEELARYGFSSALRLLKLSNFTKLPVLYMAKIQHEDSEEQSIGFVLATTDRRLSGLMLQLLKGAMLQLGLDEVWPPQIGIQEELAKIHRQEGSKIVRVTGVVHPGEEFAR